MSNKQLNFNDIRKCTKLNLGGNTKNRKIKDDDDTTITFSKHGKGLDEAVTYTVKSKNINPNTIEIVELSEEFKDYERLIRGIALYDDDDVDDTFKMEEIERSIDTNYPTKVETVEIDNGLRVEFSTFVDKQTGYGMLHVNLKDEDGKTLIENEAIYDGLTGVREIVFSESKAYRVHNIPNWLVNNEIKIVVEI